MAQGKALRIESNNANIRQANIHSQNTCSIESLNQTYRELPDSKKKLSQCKLNAQQKMF